VVHNGVIENYATLKRQLQADGVTFHSDTDTEVIAQLISHHLGAPEGGPPQTGTAVANDLIDAVSKTLALLKGTYGLAVVSQRHPGLIIGARLGSPLVLGIGQGENFLASDPSALVGKADCVVYLQDHQLCVLTAADFYLLGPISDGPADVRKAGRTRVDAPLHAIDWETGDTDKGLFEHYMLKEIYEQPEAIENALRGRLSDADATAHFGGLNLDTQQLRRADRLILTACGTSYHAALVGEYLFEEFARIPVEVEYASEFRYRNPPIDRNTIVLAITQSGETADTLAALRESKRKGHPTLALCNVVGSSIAREADGGVYLHAGPEIGVASTKAFTNQVAVLAMLALYLGRMRHLSSLEGARMVRELRMIPDVVRRTLSCHDTVKAIAERYCHVNNFLYLGRQYHYPVALEGALKLKEISYIHAEGYPAAEMKHGPIALVDEETPSVFLIPRGSIFDKVMSNLEEVKARGGPVIAIAAEGDEEVAARADEVICVPDVPDYLQPLVSVVPLQLLAYHIALLRGCDVDKPRNLAKSVTVE
jgi:glucosamine--fructose-6-phosphate aminotransferase (isomerizing)